MFRFNPAQDHISDQGKHKEHQQQPHGARQRADDRLVDFEYPAITVKLKNLICTCVLGDIALKLPDPDASGNADDVNRELQISLTRRS